VAEVNRGNTSPTPTAYFVKVDVTSWDDVVAMFTQAEAVLGGKVDFVFPNAGVASLGFPDRPGKPKIKTLNVNLIGVLYTMQAAINHFRAFKSPGRIVVTASQSSLYPLAGDPIYTVSKHGVLGLVRATAMRTVKHGILINAIGPGSTESQLMPRQVEEFLNSRGWKTPKETILQAFDLFLKPDSKHSGQLAEAVGDRVALYKFPTSSNDIFKPML